METKVDFLEAKQIVNEQDKKKECLQGEIHLYQIIHGSGRDTGIPLWKCNKCGHHVRSS